ncbi:DUF3261 domain-containing protein [Herbaspirillum sp. HC18]|nr:DUF3261 domain-containing protein [Herbaspirillum sp. HC18]
MKRILISMAALLLCGCTAAGGGCVPLAFGARYCLADAAGPEFETEQAVTVTHSGQSTVHMIVRIRSGKEGFHIAGITPLGQTLFQLSSDNRTLQSQLPPGAEGRIDGTLLAGLLQLAIWPADQVRQGLPDDVSLIERPGERIIHVGTKKLMTISWEGTALPYSHMRVDAWDAQLVIDSRELNNTEAP